MVDVHGQRIREFLLDFVVNSAESDRSVRHQTGSRPSSLAHLRAELDRHTAPQVASHHDSRALACVACCEDTIQPCEVLRLLAVPYASHPAYRPEWRPAAADPAVDGGQMARPYPLLAQMPPPGAERRRLLREAGIRITRRDFSDEEWAERYGHDGSSQCDGDDGMSL